MNLNRISAQYVRAEVKYLMIFMGRDLVPPLPR